jgi:sodium/bile acid cotransporter 7
MKEIDSGLKYKVISKLFMQLFLKKHSFSLQLFAIVGLAVVFPQPVSESGFLRNDWAGRLSVAIIFFLQGLSLPTRSLAAGYKPLRLHGFVLFWNFVCFPAITFLLLYPITQVLPAELLLGFGMLAFLPTTIASATAYTAITDGNVANAIVSTALSNILAVFVVPAVSVIYFRLEFSVEIPLGKVLLNLSYMLIAPLALGQIVQNFIPLNMDRTAGIIRRVSAGLILFIVYLAVAKSMNMGIFERLSFVSLAMTLFVVIFLLLATSALVWSSAFWIKLKRQQIIAAFYCASQKSLAAGLPLVSSILLAIPDIEDTAMVFIPLLCFHPLQMLLAGIVASLLKSGNKSAEG